ncbi:NAD(P)H-dependent glycerol-3-phosphate dehydrogenase [Zhihengliuella halotolerans]|uniref:NAD(P)H-dependent glycerol-3-phosphate dehydrogenase n=1 Tax=Zhihengliuella halotolerans TaxID=370736 RepID=UPI000C7F9DA0|nr:NAD(P)H-dependent glycerol-3-phosphate dehydrogenase [Zhihengliuella halotolerans]
MTTPTKMAVVGAGSWGTTFAKVAADAAERNADDGTICLWARREAVAAEINASHTNSQYLAEIRLPQRISATSDLREALSDANVVVLAVPAQTLRAQLREIRDDITPGAVVISLMKGLERGSDARMSEVIGDELGIEPAQIVVVSGPNLAMEIAREEPTASVVACADEEVATRIATLISAPYFRPYTNADVVGVEIGGIVKNVIALAVGICDGLGMGDNTKASVITRGLAETTRLAIALGGQLETMAGLAGLGDLVATCSSPLSRNRTAGRLLGENLSATEVGEAMTQTAEGMKSAHAVLDLARRNDVEMPIAEAVVGVLDGRLTIEGMARQLLGRDLKSETNISRESD